MGAEFIVARGYDLRMDVQEPEPTGQPADPLPASAPAPVDARPRAWTSVVAAFLALPVAVVAAVLLAGGLGPDAGQILRVTIAMEVLLAAMTLAVARLSDEGVRDRLALRSPRLRWWAWPLLVATTLSAGTAGMMTVGTLTGPPSEASLEIFLPLEQLRGPMLVLALLIVSVLPGFAEELLFRGYVQSRLARRWRPGLAVAFAAVIFAAVHGDPIYAALVLPMGLWLGAVAWWSGSTWPSMACHAVNNFARMASAAALGADVDEWFHWDLPTTLLFVACVAVTLAGGSLLLRHGRKPA